MRHRVKKVKLGTSKAHGKAMLKNLATSLILHGEIETTEKNAKAVAPEVEKLITLAKKAENGTKEKREVIRQFKKRLFGENASRKLLEEVVKNYGDRDSGFTRIVKTRYREGDAAPLAKVTFV